MDNIIRPQTEIEKNLKAGGFKDITSWRQTDIEQIELKKISEISFEYTYKKREPFCNSCAVHALHDKIDEIEDSIRRKALGRRDNKSEVVLDINIDYNRFGGLKNFELESTEPLKEEKLLDGIRTSAITGEWRKYKCKRCGCYHEIQFDKEELENGKKLQSKTQDSNNKN